MARGGCHCGECESYRAVTRDQQRARARQRRAEETEDQRAARLAAAAANYRTRYDSGQWRTPPPEIRARSRAAAAAKDRSRQDESRRRATRSGSAWTTAEDCLISDRSQTSATLAFAIGRTVAAVRRRRHVLGGAR